jgi:hypothetical protein
LSQSQLASITHYVRGAHNNQRSAHKAMCHFKTKTL